MTDNPACADVDERVRNALFDATTSLLDGGTSANEAVATVFTGAVFAVTRYAAAMKAPDVSYSAVGTLLHQTVDAAMAQAEANASGPNQNRGVG